MQPIVTSKGPDEKLKNATDWKSKYITDKCIHICAWILLTVGLCILVTTFYLAIHNHLDEDVEEGDTIGIELRRSTPASIIVDQPDIDYNMQLNRTARAESVFDKEIHEDSEEMDVSKSSPPFGLNLTIRGCQESSCRVACMQTDDIYQAIHKALSFSKCVSSDILVIKDQNFPSGTLKNSWISMNHDIHEVVVVHSNITKIKSGAFNADIFERTFFLSIVQLHHSVSLESGTLLGLLALKYLIVETKINYLDRALFQPVQTTLTYLKLSANLKLPVNQPIAGISKLNSLEYLDLSLNSFDGPLSKALFRGMPHLKYLVINKAGIKSIEFDAFSELAGDLYSLNLSNNNMKSLSTDVLDPLFQGNAAFTVNLAMNAWYCNCHIQPLSDLYRHNRSRFMEPIFCRAPHALYGTFIDDVAIQNIDCSKEEEVMSGEDVSMRTPTTSTTTTMRTVVSRPGGGLSDEDDVSTNDTVFRMRCFSVTSDVNFMPLAERATASEVAVETIETNDWDTPTLTATTGESDSNNQFKSSLGLLEDVLESEYFQFDPPSHTLELILMPNNSVMVLIEDPVQQPVNIIWFSDGDEEMFEMIYGESSSIDHSCMQYASPYLMIDSLQENTTYTFCLVPDDQLTITPFNCLPLHVPQTTSSKNNVWISQEEKHFTVAMLCMIFLVSSIVGAVIAYFGIKSHPDLLEGSKNVLVVKKSDRTCYVATIGDTADSLKEKPPLSKQASMKRHSTESKNDDMPTHQAPPPPTPLTVKGLERLASVKSSGTCFEEPPFIIPMQMSEDEYELPKPFERGTERCIQNTYATSPCMPPPLPKRNSSASDSSSVVPNRFSLNK